MFSNHTLLMANLHTYTVKYSISHRLPLCLSFQSYSGQGGGGGGSGNGAGDEDYEIPPITPPNHPEPPLLHLMDPESGYLCHSLGAHHNGLLNPYSYPELPALMMSNMLAQDGHLLSSQMPSVSTPRRFCFDITAGFKRYSKSFQIYNLLVFFVFLAWNQYKTMESI